MRHNRQCKEPCDGCGQTDKYRKKDQLCYDCKQLLDEALRIAALKKNPKGQVIVPVPKCSHWIKYISHPGSYIDPRGPLHRLIICAGTPLPGWNDAPRMEIEAGWSGSDMPVLMDKDVVTALGEVIAMIRECITAAHDNGKEEGADVLRSLAAGNISIKELNDETAPTIRKRRR